MCQCNDTWLIGDWNRFKCRNIEHEKVLRISFGCTVYYHILVFSVLCLSLFISLTFSFIIYSLPSFSMSLYLSPSFFLSFLLHLIPTLFASPFNEATNQSVTHSVTRLGLISCAPPPCAPLSLCCTTWDVVFAGVIANFDARFVKGKKNAMRHQRQGQKVCAPCSLR
jgi:hypothetical protein